jgi:hypothetical protein
MSPAHTIQDAHGPSDAPSPPPPALWAAVEGAPHGAVLHLDFVLDARCAAAAARWSRRHSSRRAGPSSTTTFSTATSTASTSSTTPPPPSQATAAAAAAAAAAAPSDALELTLRCVSLADAARLQASMRALDPPLSRAEAVDALCALVQRWPPRGDLVVELVAGAGRERVRGWMPWEGKLVSPLSPFSWCTAWKLMDPCLCSSMQEGKDALELGVGIRPGASAVRVIQLAPMEDCLFLVTARWRELPPLPPPVSLEKAVEGLARDGRRMPVVTICEDQ